MTLSHHSDVAQTIQSPKTKVANHPSCSRFIILLLFTSNPLSFLNLSENRFSKMMNVATSGSAPLPSHFAPPARMPSTRRQLYHHPTLHMRSGSGSTLAHEFVPPQSPLSVQYSPPTSHQF